MFTNNKLKLLEPADIREARKSVPYTVTPSEKGAAMRFNNDTDLRNAQKAHSRREKAIQAYNNGSGDVRDAGRFKLIETPQVKYPRSSTKDTVNTAYSSIFTRIYNWFLNIKFN